MAHHVGQIALVAAEDHARIAISYGIHRPEISSKLFTQSRIVACEPMIPAEYVFGSGDQARSVDRAKRLP